jgi:plasmid stability protein
MEDTMATLNVKNLPDPLYQKLRERAKRERRSVAQEVTRLLEEALREEEPLSLLELRGLGKELWEGFDTDEYIEGERASWD